MAKYWVIEAEDVSAYYDTVCGFTASTEHTPHFATEAEADTYRRALPRPELWLATEHEGVDEFVKMKTSTTRPLTRRENPICPGCTHPFKSPDHDPLCSSCRESPVGDQYELTRREGEPTPEQLEIARRYAGSPTMPPRGAAYEAIRITLAWLLAPAREPCPHWMPLPKAPT